MKRVSISVHTLQFCVNLTQAHRKKVIPFAAQALDIAIAVQLEAWLAAETRQTATRSQYSNTVGDLGQWTVGYVAECRSLTRD